jgi:hypothetical protein
MRNSILALLVVLVGTATAPAQGWAEKMFKDGLNHDFGNVPRGAQLSHRFTIKNIYAVPMEITGVKSGCGCVTATAVKRVLEPLESTTIDVNMDARRFTGAKTVGITITVGPDYISTAQLRVSANSRADIVFNPGEISFGTVTRGQPLVQAIDVEYAGVLPWQILEAAARDLPVDVSFREKYRRPGQVGYEIRASLRPDALTGAIKGNLYLKTNDPTSPLLAVLVEANVQSAVTVAPPNLSVGTIRVGDTLMRRVVVSANKPFRVLDVEGLGDGVVLDTPPATTPVPVQIVTFKCQPTKPGEFKREVKIKTDLQEAPVSVTIDGTATP